MTRPRVVCRWYGVRQADAYRSSRRHNIIVRFLCGAPLSLLLCTFIRVRYIIAGDPRVDNMRRNARVVRLTRAVKSLRRSRSRACYRRQYTIIIDYLF